MGQWPSISPEETILRRIPPGTRYRSPPKKPVTSVNFELREGEEGVSVTRSAITSPRELLALTPPSALASMGPLDQWNIAAAAVEDIRRIGFVVEADPNNDDPGHALIKSGNASLQDHAARQRLAKVFRILPLI